MSDFNFADQWFNVNEAKMEINNGPVLVETEGYIPPQIQIQRFLEAGERYAIASQKYFDVPDDDGVYHLDPTRSAGYDMADASMTLNNIKLKAKILSQQPTAASPPAAVKVENDLTEVK